MGVVSGLLTGCSTDGRDGVGATFTGTVVVFLIVVEFEEEFEDLSELHF